MAHAQACCTPGGRATADTPSTLSLSELRAPRVGDKIQFAISQNTASRFWAAVHVRCVMEMCVRPEKGKYDVRPLHTLERRGSNKIDSVCFPRRTGSVTVKRVP